MTAPAGHTLLVLWDVDGTLIDNGGVSKMAYALGFEVLTGGPPRLPVITDGQTDPAIMRSLLERHGIPVTAGLLDRVPSVMQEALTGLVPQLRARGRAMNGAAAAIEALSRLPDLIQSVLTGNIAPNGYTKLAAFGLEPELDFEVGGYGSDHEVRSELVTAARRRVSVMYGIDVSPAATVLIGDTPRDVEAGRRSGAYVIGVASGEFSEQRLADEGASAVLPDLTDTDRLTRAVLGARKRH